MKKNTKEVSTYILINIILLLCAALLVGFIYVEYYINKEEIITHISEQTNIIIKKVQTDENEDIASEVILPTIAENIGDETNDTRITIQKYKYYYNQLDEYEKIMYDYIEKNMDNMKSGTYSIKIPSTVGNILNEENGGERLSISFQTVWNALTLDYPELFFIDISKINLQIITTTHGTNKINSLTIKSNGQNYFEDGYDKETAETTIKTVKSKKSQIIEQLKGTEYNKIQQVHNWLVSNITYGTKSSGKNAYNIYGAIANGEAVCEGYAETFKYIMDEINIPCVLVIGKATNSEGITQLHEWNYVQLDNKWYGIDVTWDDPIIKGSEANSVSYKYFLKGKETFDINHFPDGKIGGEAKEFVYPEIVEK